MVIDFPKVLKDNNKIEFDENKIYESLLKETSISLTNARIIRDQVCREILGKKYKILTGPLIRELTCTCLWDNGLEIERGEYTRIGMPYYDFCEHLKNYEPGEIVDIIEKEYLGVKKLIEYLKYNSGI